MNPSPQNIEKHSPPSLLAGFTKSRFLVWIAAAAVLHVVVIGGLSLGFIRDTYIDPVGAAERKAAAEALAKAAAEKAAAAKAPVTPAAVATNPAASAVPATATTSATATATPPDAVLLQERKDTPVVKAVTAVAPTNEIPKQPDDLGISIKDTQIR